MKKIMQEFKDFINRGNVVDMAVGVMIGAAFKGIVDSVVNDCSREKTKRADGKQFAFFLNKRNSDTD